MAIKIVIQKSNEKFQKIFGEIHGGVFPLHFFLRKYVYIKELIQRTISMADFFRGFFEIFRKIRF